MVFNGEIYNYLELKNELKKKGIRFLQNQIPKSSSRHIKNMERKFLMN